MYSLPNPIPLDEINGARERITSEIVKTPMMKLNWEDSPAEIYLKPENLQAIGSFKIRGAINAMKKAPKQLLEKGVYTASAGNMAQGVAWYARKKNIPCTVIVPDHAPQTKLGAITRLGATYLKVPFDKWWNVLVERNDPRMVGFFIHPVSDLNVIAGNGTIGLEILDEVPDVDSIIVPYGGGGLSSGIASAVKAMRPDVKVYASEVETACPFSTSLKAGKPMQVSYTLSFVDGIGSTSILEEMWPLVSTQLNGSIVINLDQIAGAIRLLIERSRLVAEGAGASSLAAALTGQAGAGKVVCVISGGNIDLSRLNTILSGETP